MEISVVIKANIIREKVVIVGRNYGNILAMTRAIGRAGYDACILRLYKVKPRKMNLLSLMKPDADSKYTSVFNECIVGDDYNKVINSLLNMNKENKKLLLIPVDDYSCGIVDDNLLSLKDRYIIPGIDEKQGAVNELMNKQRQKILALKSGLPILKSVLIKSEGTTYEIPSDTPFPCFIKPNISMNGSKAQMAKCENKKQLEELLNRYNSSGKIELLAEEFADIKHEYSLLGMSDGDNVIVPGVFRAECGGHRERKGVAMTGVVEHTDRFELFIDKCREYIKNLRFKGLFDIDVIETVEGNIYFIEVNFRAGASIHAFTELGINMPGIFADKLVKGLPMHVNSTTLQNNKRFLSEKILLEEFARSDIALKEMKCYLKSADILFVKDSDDPKPYNNFKKYFLIAWIMRIPYRIRDRRNKKSF